MSDPGVFLRYVRTAKQRAKFYVTLMSCWEKRTAALVRRPHRGSTWQWQWTLPAGWNAKVDPATNKQYYRHAATGKVQWGFPAYR